MTPSLPLNILVLCTGNSARSILAEALFNHLGDGRIRAFSAGSQPTGRINPVALETLAKHAVPAPVDARSKSWDEFCRPGAPRIDAVFTVCGSAAAEVCPVWPGQSFKVHWGIADPAHVEPLAARQAAFETAYQALARRIATFVALDLANLPHADLATAAQGIHETALKDEEVQA